MSSPYIPAYDIQAFLSFLIRCPCTLILPSDLLIFNCRILNQHCTIQILLMHIHGGNLVIIISCIIVNSSVRITAGSINRYLMLSVIQFTAAPLLVQRAQNMEKLADTLLLSLPGNRVHLHKHRPDKSGLRR